MIQKEDEEGKVGVKIGKELMKVAGMALKANITRLGPKVLPLSEKLIFAGNYVARKVRIDTFLTYTCPRALRPDAPSEDVDSFTPLLSLSS